MFFSFCASLTAYTKKEKDNLSDAEKSEIKQLIHVLEQQLEDNL